MKLYLDDERKAPYGWMRVENADAAIFMLENRDIEEISLDHDLGHPEAGTGYDVLLWIEEQVFINNYNPPKIYVHTANPSARPKMEAAVRKIQELVDSRE